MQIIYDKDIFTISNNDKNANVVCVTTNNMIKRNGEAVMGAGIAKSVNERFHVGYKLANHLRVNGNTCADLGEYSYQNSTYHIVSFPTKDNWRDKSIIDLIIKSANDLVLMMNAHGWQHCYMRPPGCGCGGLNWGQDVKPLLDPILDDRFTVIIRH